MDEREELENLKKLLFKGVGKEDMAVVEIITEYMEGYCKIKHDCFAETINRGFEELKSLITENHSDTSKNIDAIKRELGMNGWSKKG